MIKKVMVVGAGQMGSGIAQVHAQAGIKVILYDLTSEHVEKGLDRISRNLYDQVEKGRMTMEEKQAVLASIIPTTLIGNASGADLIIEAATEQIETKKAIFSQLDTLTRQETILATNTSSLSITEIAAAAENRERVIGMHFMNPVPVMQLVELIRGLETSDGVYKKVERLAHKLGKTPVEVNDTPGFISNRLLMPMINEAAFALYEGVASKESIDQVMKLGMNHPMGPLALADHIGLDTCLFIMETLHKGFGEDKYRPCPLLRIYVNAGWLGRKSGRGFYQYTKSTKPDE